MRSILERAELCREYHFLNGKDLEKTANYLSIPVQTVREYLILVSACESVKGALISKLLSATAAIKLAHLSHEKQELAISDLLAKQAVERAKAKQERLERKKAKPKYDKPSTNFLNRLLKVPDLDRKLAATIKWLVGKGPPSEVPGLREALMGLMEREEQ